MVIESIIVDGSSPMYRRRATWDTRSMVGYRPAGVYQLETDTTAFTRLSKAAARQANSPPDSSATSVHADGSSIMHGMGSGASLSVVRDDPFLAFSRTGPGVRLDARKRGFGVPDGRVRGGEIGEPDNGEKSADR